MDLMICDDNYLNTDLMICDCLLVMGWMLHIRNLLWVGVKMSTILKEQSSRDILYFAFLFSIANMYNNLT